MSGEFRSDAGGGAPASDTFDVAAASAPEIDKGQSSMSPPPNEEAADGMKLPSPSAGAPDRASGEDEGQQEEPLQNSIVSGETSGADTPLGGDDHLQNSVLFRETVQRLGDSLPGYVAGDDGMSASNAHVDESHSEGAPPFPEQSVSTSREAMQVDECGESSGKSIQCNDEESKPGLKGEDHENNIRQDCTSCEDDAPSHVKQEETISAREPQPGIAAPSKQLNAASADGGALSPTPSKASKSLQSTPSRSKRKSPKRTTIPLESPNLDQSLLSRGMSLFARSSNQMRHPGDNDADSVVSEMTQNTRLAKPSLPDRSNDDALVQHLEEAGLVLLRRLIEFLSECPPAPGEAGSPISESPSRKQKRKQRGLTLPASALGWLSSQITGSCFDAFEGVADFYQPPKQQLECVEAFLKRVTSIRISGEAWPPPHASTAKANATTPEKGGLSSRLLSKFVADQTVDGDMADDGSFSTGPSRTGTNYDPESVASPFRRYYHELQYKPDVDMSFFPNATKVVIDGIPPSWIVGLESLQSLDMFQMEKGCILDVNELFFPSDTNSARTTAPGLRRDLSLIEETKEEDESQPDSDRKQEPVRPLVYPSMTKLRLSNCAMGEAAGLRGRPTPKSVPRLPTLARFPNLVCLNLSQNELFRSKTVFAGLNALPLLSWIDLSFNRLSSLDDIFMHVGNVTELILTGNEISSTRGLDRLFSLERLSLDQNKIHHLANVAGIAKLPFLMSLDLKGNPMEADDPASCRIKVFNLFREVRCSNLPKNATFRDMQRLLPVLDNELATKDELVALKDLTFRQTVMPVESMLSPEENEGIANVTIDESAEVSVTTGGIRHISKSSHASTAHLRMAGSASLEKKAAGRSERFHNSVDSRSISFLVDNRAGRRGEKRHHCVQFDFNDLATSIRPDVHAGDASFIGVRGRYSSNGLVSFASHQIEAEAVLGSQVPVFPFGLPLDLLAEADDDVWDPPTRLDKIPPSDTIVWEAMTSSGLAEEISKANTGDEESADLEADLRLNDGQLPLSLREGEEIDKEDLSAFDPTQADEDVLPRKSMFDDIWEQSYRDNVARDTKSVEDPAVSKETASKSTNFNTAEKNDEYDGPSDYGSLFVASDLDLYFDSFIFHGESAEGDNQEGMAPRIQLFKFDRDRLINDKRQQGESRTSKIDFRERYIGVWKEEVLACGSYARSRLPPIKLAKRGFHGDAIAEAGKDVTISESRKFILCLSDSALYFIIDDDVGAPKTTRGRRKFPSRMPPNSTFSDACWPHAVMRHPLGCLRGITIGFQFQRLILRFSVGNAATSSSLDYTYVILTSNKLRTVSLLQKLQSQVSGNEMGIGALIDNDDKSFLDALGAPRSNEVVLHYQILHQIWKRGDREASRRAFVLTDSRAYLLDEFYTGDGTNADPERHKSKKLGSVSLSIIDSAKLSRVTEVRAANEDPRKITLVILSQNKLKRSHRWRLVCGDGEGAERLIEDVRRALGSSRHDSNSLNYS